MRTKVYQLYDAHEYLKGMDAAAELLLAGEVVAFPTETVYGLGALALDGHAVSRIFSIKGRPSNNPILVHVSNLQMAESIGCFSALAKRLSSFWPAPLSLVVPAKDGIPSVVRAGLPTVGIRMPQHPAALELIGRVGPLAAPSANVSGRPSPVTAQHVLDDLDGKIPLVLDGGACFVGLESTVVDVSGDTPVLLRPGAVTQEDIVQMVGACQLAPGLLYRAEETETVRSPGMLHAHYAPRGKTMVILGENIAAHGEALLQDHLSKGEHAILVGPGISSDFHHIPCDIVGEHALFYALRESEYRGASLIIILGTEDESGENLAYLNRAIRAAGYRMIQ